MYTSVSPTKQNLTRSEAYFIDILIIQPVNHITVMSHERRGVSDHRKMDCSMACKGLQQRKFRITALCEPYKVLHVMMITPCAILLHMWRATDLLLQWSLAKVSRLDINLFRIHVEHNTYNTYCNWYKYLLQIFVQHFAFA